VNRGVALPQVVASDQIAHEAMLVVDGEHRLLAIHPAQSLESAVSAAQIALAKEYPHLHPDAVHRLVRNALPELLSLDGLLERELGMPAHTRPEPSGHAAPRRRRVSTLGCTLIAASVAAAGFAAGWTAHGAAVKPQTLPVLMNDPQFVAFADTDHAMDCTPTGQYRAVCTDFDGNNVAVDGNLGDGVVTYTFVTGDQAVYLAAFDTVQAADQWVDRRDVHGATHKNLTRRGEFIFWGDNAALVQQYASLVKDGDVDDSIGQSGDKASGGSAPVHAAPIHKTAPVHTARKPPPVVQLPTAPTHTQQPPTKPVSQPSPPKSDPGGDQGGSSGVQPARGDGDGGGEREHEHGRQHHDRHPNPCEHDGHDEGRHDVRSMISVDVDDDVTVSIVVGDDDGGHEHAHAHASHAQAQAEHGRARHAKPKGARHAAPKKQAAGKQAGVPVAMWDGQGGAF
jgi:hypothetical protein